MSMGILLADLSKLRMSAVNSCWRLPHLPLRAAVNSTPGDVSGVFGVLGITPGVPGALVVPLLNTNRVPWYPVRFIVLVLCF